MWRLTYARASLVAAGLAAAGLAQARPADGREPTFVRVVDGARAPLAGAAVTFVGNLPEVESGPVDRVVVASDARGRAMARLRTDLCYSAWAVGPAAASGVAAVSPIEGLFSAGAMLELACDDDLAPQLVRLEGLEPWQQRGPFSLHVLGWNPAADFEVATVEGGWLLPPSPLCKQVQIGVMTLELRTADGQPLLWFQGDRGNLLVPPPQDMDLVAVDEKGKPLAGVAMRQRVGQLQPWRLDGYGGATRSAWRTLGQTDAEGRLRVQVPGSVDPLRAPGGMEVLVFGAAPGRVQVVGGVRHSNVYENDRRVDKFEGQVLRFAMAPSPPLVGRCAGLPAGTMANLLGVAKLWSSDNGFMHDHRSWCVPVAEDGSFRFEGLPADLYSARVSFWHPTLQLRAPMLQAEGVRKLPEAVRADASAAPAFAEVEVRVTDAHGGPARGAVLQLGPGNRGGTQLRYSIARVPLDTSGTARILVPPGPLALLATGTGGFVGQLVDVPAGAFRCDLQMKAFASMQVRFLGHDDQPIIGASPRVTRATTRGSSDPVGGLLQGMESNMRWRMTQLHTDAEGRLSIPFVPIEGITLQLTLNGAQGASPPFELEVSGEEIELRPK